MSENDGKVDWYKEQIKSLWDKLSAHEAQCVSRYSRLDDNISKTNSKIDQVLGAANAIKWILGTLGAAGILLFLAQGAEAGVVFHAFSLGFGSKKGNSSSSGSKSGSESGQESGITTGLRTGVVRGVDTRTGSTSTTGTQRGTTTGQQSGLARGTTTGQQSGQTTSSYGALPEVVARLNPLLAKLDSSFAGAPGARYAGQVGQAHGQISQAGGGGAMERLQEAIGAKTEGVLDTKRDAAFRQQGADDIQKRLTQQFAGAGRYGSPIHQGTLARELGRYDREWQQDQFNRDRQAIDAGVAGAQGMQNLQYSPIEREAGVLAQLAGLGGQRLDASELANTQSDERTTDQTNRQVSDLVNEQIARSTERGESERTSEEQTREEFMRDFMKQWSEKFSQKGKSKSSGFSIGF